MTGAEVLIRQGRREGREEGQRRLLLVQLEAKFGPLSEATISRVEALSAEGFDRVGRAILTAPTLDALAL